VGWLWGGLNTLKARVFLFVALLIFLMKLPEIREIGTEGRETSDAKLSGTLAFRHLIKGVIAQFFYVGVQVGMARLHYPIRRIYNPAPDEC
jgi:fucose permease